MAQEICVDIEQHGSAVSFRLAGPEIKLNDMEAVVAECSDHMRFDHASNFAMDLSAIEFLDSACLGCLVELMRELEPMRGRIALVGCRPNVVYLFKITQLDSVIGLFDDMEEAIDSFSKRDCRR